jgi:hypothetical protein
MGKRRPWLQSHEPGGLAESTGDERQPTSGATGGPADDGTRESAPPHGASETFEKDTRQSIENLMRRQEELDQDIEALHAQMGEHTHHSLALEPAGDGGLSPSAPPEPAAPAPVVPEPPKPPKAKRAKEPEERRRSHLHPLLNRTR